MESRTSTTTTRESVATEGFRRPRHSRVSRNHGPLSLPLVLLFAVAVLNGFLSAVFLERSTLPGGMLCVSALSLRTPGNAHASRSQDSATTPTGTNTIHNGGNNRAALGRRDVLGSGVATAGAFCFAGIPWLAGMEAANAASSGGGPVAIVGASGRTGSLCVNACLRRGIPVRALTRTGEWTSPPTPEGAVTTFTGDTSSLLTIRQCDVTSTDLEALTQTLEGCSAVIYAASASKNGGTALQVDNRGVCKIAQAAVAAKVSRCVVISSTSTTRPKSLGYVFTNLSIGGNIMGEKRNGELGTMAAMAPSSTSSSYTIVRPGGLEEPKRNKVLGPSALELSQGDVFAGIVSRADVAEATVELALSEAPNVKNTAVELYYTDSVLPVEGKFNGLLNAAREVGSPEYNKLRLHGSTYSELFQTIRPGVDFEG